MRKINSLFLSLVFAAVPIALFAQATTTMKIQSPNISQCIPVTNLAYGSKDSAANKGAVSILQNFLIVHGYLSASSTGFFGNLTLQAVKEFQSTNNIPSTGYVGPLTRAAIQSSCVQMNSSNPVSVQSSGLGFVATALSSSASTATFGNTNVGSWNPLGTAKNGIEATLTQSGTVESMSFYFSNSGFDAKVAIYANANGSPSTLLTQSTSQKITSSGWQTFSLPQITLSSGTYWLAVVTDGANSRGAVTLNTGKTVWEYTSYGSEFSSTFGSLSGNVGSVMAAYVTYVPAATSAPTPAPVVTPAPTVTISTASGSIAYDAATTVTWSSTNATACTVAGGSSSWTGTSGSDSTGDLTANTTYTATCTGAGGTGTQSATITVAAATTPPVTTPTSVVTGIDIVPSNPTIAPESLEPFIITDQNGNTLSTTTTWTSSNTSVGTISSNGLFTVSASSSGITTVTATVGSLSNSTTITVSTSTYEQSTATTTLRNKYLWPFSSTSIWNMPIGSNAVYVAAGLQPADAWYGDIITDPEFISVDPNAPVKTASFGPATETTNGDFPSEEPTVTYQTHVLPGLTYTGGYNGCATLLGTNDNSVYQGQPLYLLPGGSPVMPYYNTEWFNVSLYGSGIYGCHGGTDLSGIGGSIRIGDLDQPAIHHALKIELDGALYFSMANGGYTWPADKTDSSSNPSSSQYAGGKVPQLVEGSLLALPPTAANIAYINTIQSPNAKKIAQALMDYGGYVVDNTAWDVDAIAVENGADFDDGGTFDSDLQTVFTKLAVVTNNSSTTIGGGGTPLVPLAPAGFAN